MTTKKEYKEALKIVNSYELENNEHDIRLCKIGSKIRYNLDSNKTWKKGAIYTIENIYSYENKGIRPKYHIRTEKGMSWVTYHHTNKFTVVKI